MELEQYKDFVTVKSTGLDIKHGMPIESWLKLGDQLKQVESGIQWWIGDWINYGEKEYGEKYAQALDATDYTEGSLRNIASVANSIEMSRRHDNVSFSAHQEVAQLEPSKQDDILNNTPTVSLARQLTKELKHAENPEKLLDIRPVEYGKNIFYNSGSYQEERWDDHIITDDYPTLTRIGRFFHEDMTEFSLREYARVQDFPDSYKFVGNYSSIKGQIGNAVSVKMAQHIGKKLKGTTVIDLFAGCGGLSCGLESIGKKAVFANEREKDYFATYIANHPNTKVSVIDIRNLKLEDIPDADIVVGGPPCQGFSSAGLQLKDDPRNEMYKEFLRIVDGKQVKEFLMENVPEIETIKDQIIQDFNDIGYKVEFEIVQGKDIGMKQSRTRAFFYGTK